MNELKKQKNNDPIILRIVKLLEDQNKTQKELTDYLGITQNAFTDWKSGRLKSYKKYVYEIASFLGVSAAYLIDGKEPNNISSEEFTNFLTFLSPNDKKTKKEPTAVIDVELENNVVIFHRDGKTRARKFTEEQMLMFLAMLAAIPENPKDDI